MEILWKGKNFFVKKKKRKETNYETNVNNYQDISNFEKNTGINLLINVTRSTKVSKWTIKC